MDLISSNTYSAISEELVPTMSVLNDLPGGYAVFGVANTGKTYLAECMVSYFSDHLKDRHNSISALDSVVVAALESWFGPSFFRAASGRMIAGSELQDWAREFIDGIGLSTHGNLRALAAIDDPSVCSHVDRRLKLLPLDVAQLVDKQVSPSAGSAQKVYWFEYNGKEYVGAFALRPNGRGTDVMAAIELDQGENSVISLFDVSDIELEPGDPEKYVEGLLYVLQSCSIASIATDDSRRAAWFCAPLYSSVLSVAEGEAGHIGSSTVFANGDITLCITQNGVQYRTPDDVEAYSSHGYVPSDEDMSGQLLERYKTAPDSTQAAEGVDIRSSNEGDVSITYSSLLREDPTTLLAILSASGAIATAVAYDDSALSSAFNNLKRLVAMLDLQESPTLIMTEMKSTARYGASAYNKHLEMKGVELTLRDNTSGSVTFTAPCSLVTAALGSLILFPVTHISVLDATMSSEIVFSGTTQKGGLDSSALHKMQFFSNVASLCGGKFVMETRDDFVVSNNEEEALNRARATLGANSAVAIQISGTGATPRSLWVRVKGGDVLPDAVVEFPVAELRHYPENTIRPNDASGETFGSHVAKAIREQKG